MTTPVVIEAGKGHKRKHAQSLSVADQKRARRRKLALEALTAVKPEKAYHYCNGEQKSSNISPSLATYENQSTRPTQQYPQTSLDHASYHWPASSFKPSPVVIDLTIDDDLLEQPLVAIPWSTLDLAQGGAAKTLEPINNYIRFSDHPETIRHVPEPEVLGPALEQTSRSSKLFKTHDTGYAPPVARLPQSGSGVPPFEAQPGPTPMILPDDSQGRSDNAAQHGALAPQNRSMLAVFAESPAALRISSTKQCSCGKQAGSEQDSVRCAGETCEHESFHKACVGLAKRKDTTGWHCYKCRRKAQPPAQNCPPTMVCPITTVPVQVPEYTPISGEPEPPLHEEQERVVRAIASGENVFYTGSAGVGKSTVLKAFVKSLKQKGKHVDIIAPSGIAALNVGGMTIHAYAGWHVDAFKEGLNSLIRKSQGKNVRKRLSQTDVLVIDEISMVERDVLVRLDTIMREVRHGWQSGDLKDKKRSQHTVNAPFGGVQVVVTGDFCQLPPVKPFRFCLYCGGDELPGYELKDGRTLTCTRCRKEYEDEQKWAFCSDTWAACNFRYFELRHIHRQSDKRFIDILQKCRFGRPLSSADQQLLLTPKADPEGAVKLLPRRVEVDSENLKNYRSLQNIERKFDSVDYFSWRNREEPSINQKYSPLKYPHRPNGPLMALKDHRLEEQILVKEGMLVILITNLDFTSGLVNGSQGRIIGFEKHDDKNVFEPKPPPSPPSSKRRARSLAPSDGSEYAAIKESQVRTFIIRTSILQWPIVQFHNGVVRPIYAECQLGELGCEKPYSLLGRTQIPLLAAWAITVHKSQGMTLNRVIVDLYSSFEKEMVYVALSRARNLEGLKVLRLARQMDSGVNKEVQGFLKEHGMLG